MSTFCFYLSNFSEEKLLLLVLDLFCHVTLEDGGGGHWLVWMEWRPAGWSVSASVNFPLHHKVQKFSSGTGSPWWSRKKGRKMVMVVVVL